MRDVVTEMSHDLAEIRLRHGFGEEDREAHFDRVFQKRPGSLAISDGEPSRVRVARRAKADRIQWLRERRARILSVVRLGLEWARA